MISKLWTKAKKAKNHLGMTMAEMLIVVGIIGVLAAVAFIAVQNHQRTMGQLERDGIAKEIFVAAQNHLAASKGSGYLNLNTGYGTRDDAYKGMTEDEKKKATKDGQSDIYYVTNESDAAVLGFMFPTGAVDIPGGSFLIRYQRSTGTLLDVFYCSSSNGLGGSSFDYPLRSSDYDTVMGLRGDANKNARKKWTNGSILGYYGGADVQTLEEITLTEPEIIVHNEDKLYVEIKDTNAGKSGFEYTLKLLVTGVSSEKIKGAVVYEIGGSNSALPDDRVNKKSGSGDTYYLILDDLTESGLSFKNFCSSDTEKYHPGEDLKIQAVTYSKTKLANVAYSSEANTNSLFASIAYTGSSTGTGSTGGTTTQQPADTAYISSIRHLENLDPTVSGYSKFDNKFEISRAEQTTDMSWSGFRTNIADTLYTAGVTKLTPATAPKAETVSVYYGNTQTSGGCYYPVNPTYVLSYDGNGYSISDIDVSFAGPAGLFGTSASAASGLSEVKDLELIDFSISSSGGDSGALAGSLTGTTVTNVLARNSKNVTNKTIATTGGNAGGLIGSLNAGTVSYSAAALIVNGSANAGGLIGSTVGSVTVTGSYSGGHTDKAEYYQHGTNGKRTDPIYNVTGATAGGLIGNAGSATVNYCYSTCSVSGTGNSAVGGGLIGTADGATVSNSYCTGLVLPNTKSVTESGKTTTHAADNAFLGSGSLNGSSAGNNYYEIINEVTLKEGTGATAKVTGIEYQGAGTAAATPFDASAATYESFLTSTRRESTAYDKELVNYYSGKYHLKTVEQLGASLAGNESYAWDTTATENAGKTVPFVIRHYGDWPAPEIFVFNSAS